MGKFSCIAYILIVDIFFARKLDCEYFSAHRLLIAMGALHRNAFFIRKGNIYILHNTEYTSDNIKR